MEGAEINDPVRKQTFKGTGLLRKQVVMLKSRYRSVPVLFTGWEYTELHHFKMLRGKRRSSKGKSPHVSLCETQETVPWVYVRQLD